MNKEKESEVATKKQNTKWMIGILAIVVLLIFIFGGKQKSIEDEIPDLDLTEKVLKTSESIENISKPTISNKHTSKPNTTTLALTYAQALAKYGDYRIQFDNQCQARPSNATYKNGTSIMLDNRSGVERKIKINTTYIVPAYGFRIVTISSSSVPTTYLVDCGASQNVATILVQK